MITEDFVSFEVAKLLKEKGFDKDVLITDWWYDANGIAYKRGNYSDHNSPVYDNETCFNCPTLQMAVKWLRKKGFHIFVPLEIDYDEDERGDKWYHDAAYYPEIRRVSDGKIMYDDGSLYAEPEQVYEVAIKYCLENFVK